MVCGLEEISASLGIDKKKNVFDSFFRVNFEFSKGGLIPFHVEFIFIYSLKSLKGLRKNKYLLHLFEVTTKILLRIFKFNFPRQKLLINNSRNQSNQRFFFFKSPRYKYANVVQRARQIRN